ncbi:ATPase, AAA-type, core [Acididesulfobacillus acetoxydans]|uniref:AAA ATPase central domain protein n=1 Tax=Acididesulfobacillus acetoxydans TaxID=1561005 RepID=A0A8S0W3Q4_9FIRM|nr:MoxR family ATPase [Acididesulfobacillus acetoxydans]CAA7601898.1 ATPase, AAA-type, core [Acididesulfobacillus acetoxydans]CEJ08258.1 AAA ATPase central domain protein [Acididesulfobacillus acetoxydans]
MWDSPAALLEALADEGYLLDEEPATTLFLALALEKPCLIEGPAGVGKTQLALALARAAGRRLLRLQCYEGLDTAKALYDWDYAKQLLRLQAGKTENWDAIKTDLFGAEFLLARPLLQAIRASEPVLLLIDELDKSDEEFESFLLELLAEFQVTIPELGTIRAEHKPVVILTSNNARDFSDALRRRCVNLNLSYPTLEREVAILRRQCPEIAQSLLDDVAEFVAKVRKLPLRKLPSVSESLDFARALHALQRQQLALDQLPGTLAVLLKYPKDLAKLEERLQQWQTEAARAAEVQ